MSNYLAVAAVTASLNYLLTSVFQAELNAAGVSTVAPHAIPKGTGVNIFLYQVSPNAALRNEDLPTMDADQRLVGRPRAALDLHYLLSVYGDDTTLEPQRVLGLVTRTLHAQPVLTRQLVTTAVGAFNYVNGSDLADDIELVRFTALTLTLDDLSRLWTMFPSTQYLLSAMYQASVVLIESPQTPVHALPVRVPKVFVNPIETPVIEAVTTTDPVQPAPIVSTSTLSIRGRNLKADVTQVRLGGLPPIAPPAADVTAREIRIAIPAALAAGPTGVQVVHVQPLGQPLVAHTAVVSNTFPITYQPTASNPVPQNVAGPPANRSGDITVDVGPAVQRGQRVTVLLNATPGPGAFSFPLLPSASSAPLTSVTAHFSGLPAGPYVVRVDVDGATSPVGPAVNL